MRWGSSGDGVCRDMMHLHNWGYLWHHCGWATDPKYGEWHRESGRSIAPMCDRRGSVGGMASAHKHAKWDSVGGRDTAPMCYRWDNLIGQYGWW